MSKIYKYFSSDVMELIFERDGFCGIKCSYPKDYNDPYELFLGVNTDVDTECLATYKDIINEIPQYPTSCFSRSAIVSPMWAHYAREQSGFVLEFDTEVLKEHFQDCIIKEISYKNKPDERLEELLLRTSIIKKPRYAYFLLQSTILEAYFSKYTDWSYEQEVRFVDSEGYCEDVGDNKILFIPSECVTSVIVGSKFPSNMLDLSHEKAGEHSLDWYQLEIGKSYPVPYMRDHSNNVFIFDGTGIIEAENCCLTCAEPLSNQNETCPWCSITEAHKLEAAAGNPFRMLDHYGRLEGYLEEISKVGKKD